MKDKNQHQNKLFSALFNEGQKLSKEQLEKAKSIFQRNPLPEDQKDKFDNIRELQYRLNARRTELLSKALETDKISEDQEIKDHLDSIQRTYSDLGSLDSSLSIEDCPKLPPPKGYISRLHAGQQSNNNVHLELFSYSETETAGMDDNLEGIEDLDHAEADVDGALFHVLAESMNKTVFPQTYRSKQVHQSFSHCTQRLIFIDLVNS